MQPLRWVGLGSFLVYVFLHQLILDPWVELLGYNVVAIAATATILSAPRISDPIAKPFTAIAVALWTAGSILASSSTVLSLGSRSSNFSNILYLLFWLVGS